MEIPAVAFLTLIVCGLLIYFLGIRPARERRSEWERGQLEFDRALEWHDWLMRSRRPNSPLEIELEDERLWGKSGSWGAKQVIALGGSKPVPETLTRPDREGLSELEPALGTFLQVDAGLQTELVLGTLLQVGTALRVSESYESELVPGALQVEAGLQAIGLGEPGPVPQTLLRADAGPQLVPAATPQVSPGRQAAEPVQVSAGVRVIGRYEPGPALGTLLRVSAGLPPAPGTSPLVGAGLQPVVGTLLQIGAELQATGLSESEPAPGLLHVVNLYEPKLVPETLTRPGGGAAGGGRAGEAAAGVVLSAAGGGAPRVIEPGGPEPIPSLEVIDRNGPGPVPGVLLQVNAGLRPAPGTLLQVDAAPQVVEPSEPEPVSGPQVIGLREPEFVLGTPLQPGEGTAGVVLSLAEGAGLPRSGLIWHQVTNRLADPCYPDTLIQAACPVAFFENLFPGAAEHFIGGTSLSNTQPTYTSIVLAAPDGFEFADYTFIQSLLVDQSAGRFSYPSYQPQLAAPPAFPTAARSNYDSGRFSLRQHVSDDLTFDFNYTPGQQPEPVSGTLLQVDAGLPVIELSEPELALGLQVVELIPGTLLQVDAGLEPAGVTLLQVGDSGSSGQPAEFSVDDVKAAFNMFRADGVKAAFEMFIAARQTGKPPRN